MCPLLELLAVQFVSTEPEEKMLDLSLNGLGHDQNLPILCFHATLVVGIPIKLLFVDRHQIIDNFAVQLFKDADGTAVWRTLAIIGRHSRQKGPPGGNPPHP